MRATTFAAIAICYGLFAGTASAETTTLNIAGSTALQPLMSAAAEGYAEKQPDVKILVAGGGSRSGLSRVASGEIDLAASDVEATGYPTLIDHRVAVIGFEVIASAAAGVDNLTRKALQNIFSGKVANWKDVGGADQKIVIINRPPVSGTALVFTRTLMGDAHVADSPFVEDSSSVLVATVKATPGAISYVAMKAAHGSGVVEMKLDGVAPTEENIADGRFPFYAYEHAYTNGPPIRPLSRFLAFLISNGELLHKYGYVLIRDMRGVPAR